MWAVVHREHQAPACLTFLGCSTWQSCREGFCWVCQSTLWLCSLLGSAAGSGARSYLADVDCMSWRASCLLMLCLWGAALPGASLSSFGWIISCFTFGCSKGQHLWVHLGCLPTLEIIPVFSCALAHTPFLFRFLFSAGVVSIHLHLGSRWHASAISQGVGTCWCGCLRETACLGICEWLVWNKPFRFAAWWLGLNFSFVPKTSTLSDCSMNVSLQKPCGVSWCCFKSWKREKKNFAVFSVLSCSQ